MTIEMHPRIKERRWEVFSGRMGTVSDAEFEKNVGFYVRHCEGKLPKPENYRKKTTERLRINLRTIDELLVICKKEEKTSYMLSELGVMYLKHRGYIVKELARRGKI
jgi:hypothetical protein